MAISGILRKGWRLTAPLLVLAAALLVFLMLVWTRPDPPAEAPTEPTWTVATELAQPGSHTPVLRTFGYIESPSAATLTAAVEADVAAVPARDGETVAEGELLVELDDRELRDTLRQRQAELDELEAQLRQERRAIEADREDLAAERALLEIDERRVDRIERLLADDAASPSDLDDAEEAKERQRQAVIRAEQAVDDAEERLAVAEARRDAAEAARDRAARDVGRTEVRAPAEGRISGVEVAPGDRISPGGALVEFYDTSELELRVQIPTTRIGALQRARAAEAPLAGRARVDGRELELTLERLAGRSERERGGVEAVFAVAERHEGVPLERFAEAELELPAEPDTLVVPYEALYGDERIYIVEEAADDAHRLRGLEARRIGEARRPDGRLGALVRVPEVEPGMAIVTTQIPQATDGLRVQPEERDR